MVELTLRVVNKIRCLMDPVSPLYSLKTFVPYDDLSIVLQWFILGASTLRASAPYPC